LLRLETCPFGLPLGCRACSRAISRLSTFFILFDREISFMNHPQAQYRRLKQVDRTKAKELGSTSSARKWHGLLRLWRLRSGPQSQPIDPEMFRTQAPRTFRDGQHPTFQTVPAATAFSFFSPQIPPTVCSVCHTRHADTPLAPVNGESAICPLSGPKADKLHAARS
jgi:hypothetical protein